MGEVKEACAICWRDFCEEVVPVMTSCGHTYCRDCSTNMRRCALCRKKLPSSYQWPANFALMSLLDKITSNARNQATQMSSKEVQTDVIAPRRTSRSRRTLSEANPQLPPSCGVSIKITRDTQGGMKTVLISMKN